MNTIFLKILFLSMSMSVNMLCVGAHRGEGVGSPGSGVTGSCETPYICAGIGTWIS